MTGSHQGPDLIYKFNNLCIRPSGRLAGWKPDLRIYNGGTERISSKYSYQKTLNSVNRYLTENVDVLTKEPTWYVDRKLAIMPMPREFHVAHTLQKVGGLISSIESGFPREKETTASSGGSEEEGAMREDSTTSAPSSSASRRGADQQDWAREDVTTVYANIWLPNHRCGKYCSFMDTPHGQYQTLATTTHFTVFDERHLDKADKANKNELTKLAKLNKKKKTGSRKMWKDDGYRVWKQKTSAGWAFPDSRFPNLVELMNDNPICFKEAIVYQSCFLPDCINTTEHSRSSWPFIGFRQPRTQQKIARRFRACAAVEHLGSRSTVTKADQIALLYSYRTRGRKLVNQPVILFKLWQWLQAFTTTPPSSTQNTNNADSENFKLYSSEMSTTTLPTSIALYSSVDVVVSVYGSGFLYAFLLPPSQSSGGIEILAHGLIGSHPTITGVDRNPFSDYGSLWRANGGNQIAIGLSPWNERVPDSQIAVPLPLLKRGLESFFCLRELHRRDTQRQSSLDVVPPVEPVTFGGGNSTDVELEAEEHGTLTDAGDGQLKFGNSLVMSPRVLLQRQLCEVVNQSVVKEIEESDDDQDTNEGAKRGAVEENEVSTPKAAKLRGRGAAELRRIIRLVLPEHLVNTTLGAMRLLFLHRRASSIAQKMNYLRHSSENTTLLLVFGCIHLPPERKNATPNAPTPTAVTNETTAAPPPLNNESNTSSSAGTGNATKAPLALQAVFFRQAHLIALELQIWRLYLPPSIIIRFMMDRPDCPIMQPPVLRRVLKKLNRGSWMTHDAGIYSNSTHRSSLENLTMPLTPRSPAVTASFTPEPGEGSRSNSGPTGESVPHVVGNTSADYSSLTSTSNKLFAVVDDKAVHHFPKMLEWLRLDLNCTSQNNRLVVLGEGLGFGGGGGGELRQRRSASTPAWRL